MTPVHPPTPMQTTNYYRVHTPGLKQWLRTLAIELATTLDRAVYYLTTETLFASEIDEINAANHFRWWFEAHVFRSSFRTGMDRK